MDWFTKLRKLSLGQQDNFINRGLDSQNFIIGLEVRYFNCDLFKEPK